MGPLRVSVHSSFPVGEASEEAVGAEANYPSFGFDPSVTREGLALALRLLLPQFCSRARRDIKSWVLCHGE